MQIFQPFIGAGKRPRVACEIRPEGIVAARADDAAGSIAAAAQVSLPRGSLSAGPRPGNLVDRAVIIAALKRALDQVADRTNDVTLIVPDNAVRVLLLDFDSLPNKPAEALPVVRFRLKKLLPFEAEDAAVSYQIMSGRNGLVRVIAAALPRDVLHEYEFALQDAGYEPGAVLPSTLAAIAGLNPDSASLIVNAGSGSVTTAIVNADAVLLHRTLDLTAEVPSLQTVQNQENVHTEEAAQLAVIAVSAEPHRHHEIVMPEKRTALLAEIDGGSPIAAQAAMQSAVLKHELAVEAAVESRVPLAEAQEIAEAIAVAAAYYEDMLGSAPQDLLCAGNVGAVAVEALLKNSGFGERFPRVRELVGNAQMLAGANTTGVVRGLLAGVAGALKTGAANL